MKKIAKSRITQVLLVLAVFSFALVLSSNQRTQAQAGGSGRTTTCSTGANTTFTDTPFYDFFSDPNNPITSIGAGAGTLTFDRIITVNFTGPQQTQQGIATGCGTDGCAGTTFPGTTQLNRWFNIFTSTSPSGDDTCNGANARVTVEQVAFFPYWDNGTCSNSNRVISLRDFTVNGCGGCLSGSRVAIPPAVACIIVDALTSGVVMEIGQNVGTGACGTLAQGCGGYGHYRVRISCTTAPAGAC